MGILYSRFIGVLISRWTYIVTLDHDDMFFDEDVFDKLYQSTEKGKYDIMKDGMYTQHINNLIVHQPELSYYTLFKNDDFSAVDIQIWGKLFKDQVYKNAVNLLGIKRYSIFNALNEDMIGLFSICNVAKSYKYIRKYGLFHFLNIFTASQIASKEYFMNMEIFFCDVIFDLSKIIMLRYFKKNFFDFLHFLIFLKKI